jgi:predicted MarR family transcription regulator
MTPFFIALAVASVAFWRAAVKILAVVALFLLASGMVTVVHYLHHIR